MSIIQTLTDQITKEMAARLPQLIEQAVKDSFNGPPTAVTPAVAGNGKRAGGNTADAKAARRDAILKALQTDAKSAAEVAKEIGESPAGVGSALYNMFQKGLVSKTRGGKFLAKAAKRAA